MQALKDEISNLKTQSAHDLEKATKEARKEAARLLGEVLPHALHFRTCHVRMCEHAICEPICLIAQHVISILRSFTRGSLLSSRDGIRTLRQILRSL